MSTGHKEFDELFSAHYDQLLKLARSLLRKSSLSFTAKEFVHQLYVLLLTSGEPVPTTEEQLISTASETMKRLAEVESARASRSFRTAAETQSGSLAAKPALHSAEDLSVLDEALHQLGQRSPQQLQIVEAKLFGEFTVSEIAALLDIHPEAVKREWNTARARLASSLHLRRQSVKSGRSVSATVVQVFYATDRKPLDRRSGGLRYGDRRSPQGALRWGRCEVSIPKFHRKGKLETPSLLRFEFRPDPERHIELLQTIEQDERAVLSAIASEVQKTEAQDAFVFVHGYNVSFTDAARRTGQIAFDMDFHCVPIFYSWPSNGRRAEYLRDETENTWTVPHLERFLTLLSGAIGAKRIHVIAHSMGNRAVCDALSRIGNRPGGGVPLMHLVLAAPDIDAGTFQELGDGLRKLAKRITLYESSNDKALKASKLLHRYPRAGEPVLVVEGMDTIDASNVDTDFLGHSYFSDTWPLLADMHAILCKDEPPSRRFGLHSLDHQGGRYYAFKA